MRRGLVALAGGLLSGWLAAAVWFQFAGPLRAGLLLALGLLTLWLALRWWQRRPVGRWLVLMAVVAAGWWATILPQQGRDWDADVSRGVTMAQDGDSVRLANLRDFEWRSETAFDARWQDRSYDLSSLQTVDLVTSVWGSPHIAHTLLSFGFADGQHVVFSSEIRRERGEAFSSIGGFFKQFELVMIAADERDILRLRSDIRGETVSIWRLSVTQDQARAMFLALGDYANALQGRPRWYHTVWTNCTTLPWFLANRLDAALTPDWRVLLSGHIADYLKDVGLITPEQTAETAEVKPTTNRTETGPAYSRLLRDAAR